MGSKKITAILLAICLITALAAGFVISSYYILVSRHIQYNVILIIIDALRPDHLGAYGYSKNTSPNIDKLASEATLFKTAVTVCPHTRPSAVSILTGLYPHTHGVRSVYTETRYNHKSLTLAGILSKKGYSTGAFIHQPVLKKDFGLGRGFETYINCGEKDINKNAIKWLKMQKKPVFIMFWYMAPHWPYQGCSGIAEEDSPPEKVFKEKYNSEEIKTLINCYDGEIIYDDKLIGEVIGYLKKSGLYDNSIIVLTSDHGESLGEHDYYFDHGHYYYDQSALVPLIIKGPGQNKKKVVNRQARTIDIFPTILGILNINYSAEGVDLTKNTEDLLAFGENEYKIYNLDRRYVYGIAGKWRIVRSDRYKLIFIPHPEKDIYEFYDIKNDPGELNNLIDNPSYQSQIQYMKEKLFGWIKPHDLQDKEAISLRESVKKRLKSLGYIQ